MTGSCLYPMRRDERLIGLFLGGYKGSAILRGSGRGPGCPATLNSNFLLRDFHEMVGRLAAAGYG